jgi:hypothetical protein
MDFAKPISMALVTAELHSVEICIEFHTRWSRKVEKYKEKFIYILGKVWLSLAQFSQDSSLFDSGL